MDDSEKPVAVSKPMVTIVRTLSILFALIFLNGCGRDNDSALQKKLSGTWVMQETYTNGGTFQSTVNVAPDGNYSCQIVLHSVSNIVRTNELGGTWQVKDGIFIDTMTRHSNTNAHLPMIDRARILRLDDQELNLKYEQKDGVQYPTNGVIFRKIAK